MLKFDHINGGFEYLESSVCFISGGGSSGSSSQQSTSGFQALSPQIQQVFNTLATQSGSYLDGGSNSGQLTNMYTPAPLTSGENNAISSINQGFTPTASQINSSVSEQMNPYNQDVINQINQNAYGQNSVLQGQLASDGQFGSNRAALGANNIANTQASEIGSLLNPEYNTALNNALTTIPQLNAQSAQAQLQTGQFLQGQQQSANQAPITGLSSLAQVLGVLPTNSGQSTGGSNQSAFNFGVFSSDDNLKENIVPMGEENGVPIYAFNYKGGKKRFLGVLAKEIEKIIPAAVTMRDGFKAVDYEMIGVNFGELT